jgi:hypothetical protein
MKSMPDGEESTMTRKDYELIARALNKSRIQMGVNGNEERAKLLIQVIAYEMALGLKHDNRNFDPHLFYKGCGIR